MRDLSDNNGLISRPDEARDEPVTASEAPRDASIDVAPDASPDENPSAEEIESGLRELRSLLFGPETTQLAALRERVENPQLRAEDLSRDLAEALEISKRDGRDLAPPLTPNVEDAIAHSVRQDPQVLAEALFPIMGPAIRSAIAAALQSMMQSLNETLEHSVSPKSVRWRLEAMRTGKPFSEIVLLHTLLYRVEQVFLIHRETGLLLQHVAASEVAVQDADMVSGMLSAIQDFVRDSFATRSQDALQTLNFGELVVWIEQGHQILVAGVIRGTPPEPLHETFSLALERIYRELGHNLENFAGDAAPFEAARPHLEACLKARFNSAKPDAAERKKAADDATVKRNRAIQLKVFAGLVILALSVPIFFHFRNQRRWQNYLQGLKNQPGIVVLEVEKRGGKTDVTGMRDPLAVDPQTLLSGAHIEARQVRFHWQPFHSLEAKFVLERARQILDAPRSVRLELKDGTLIMRGAASASWIKTARFAARFVPGVERVDSAQLRSR